MLPLWLPHRVDLPETLLPAAPGLPGRPLLDQHWRDLAFLHWPVDPAAVSPWFPPGTRPDVLDGRTWVSLVPFRMVGAGLGVGRPVPWLGSFLETNVRLYSVDQSGRHGVVFRSLDADRLLTVLGARAALGFRYCSSRMREEVDGDVVTWSSVRRWPRPARGGRAAATRIRVRIGGVVDPTPLDVFLTARWGAHTRVAGRTLWVPNQHGPWPLQEAELLDLEDSLCLAAGVPVQGPPALVRFTRGVRTQFGAPVVVQG